MQEVLELLGMGSADLSNITHTFPQHFGMKNLMGYESGDLGYNPRFIII